MGSSLKITVELYRSKVLSKCNRHYSMRTSRCGGIFIQTHRLCILQLRAKEFNNQKPSKPEIGFGSTSVCSSDIQSVTSLFFTGLLLYNKRGSENLKNDINVRSCNHCCRGKEMSITYSQFVSVALSIQQATRMRRISFSAVACLTLLYFYMLSHKLQNFR